MKHGIILTAIALGLIASAYASQAARPGSNLSARDRQFITAASQGGTTEVELGQLAVSKRDGRQVQQFAQRMIQDHSAANNKLMSIAANDGVKLPTDPRRAMGPMGRAAYDRLNRLSGSQFSQAYMALMVRAHEKDAAAFRREARYGHDPNVRAFARYTLPMVEHHLSMAGTLDAEVNNRPTRMYAHRQMHM